MNIYIIDKLIFHKQMKVNLIVGHADNIQLGTVTKAKSFDPCTKKS